MNAHPYYAEKLAHGHTEELEREAEQARLAASVGEARPGTTGMLGALRAAVGDWLQALEPVKRQSSPVALSDPSGR
jgi:hypothetical protein